jgi:glutaredoxin 3
MAAAGSGEFIVKLTTENHVVMFSKSYCPYCVRAKGLLGELGVQFEVVELDQRGDGSRIQDELARMTGQRSVPNTFIKGSSIGGCDDLFALHRKGNLTKLLKGK